MANPIESTNADQSFEPGTHCVNHWPETVMGFNTCGNTPKVPVGVDYDRMPGIQNSSKDVNDGTK